MKNAVLLSIICCVISSFSSTCYGQEGLPPGVTEDSLTNDIINQVNSAGGPADTGTATNTTNTGSAGDSGDTLNADQLDTENDFSETTIEVTPDTRNQRGFVGVSLEDPDSVLAEYRFVGAQGESVTTTNAGQRGGLGAGGRNGMGAMNGFEVQRISPIRTRVVRAFRAPRVSPNFVATRVNRRLSTLPATQQFSNAMNVTMRGRTAIISGTAQSQTQIDRIRRQLRLEPGVSRIESQVRIVR